MQAIHDSAKAPLLYRRKRIAAGRHQPRQESALSRVSQSRQGPIDGLQGGPVLTSNQPEHVFPDGAAYPLVESGENPFHAAEVVEHRGMRDSHLTRDGLQTNSPRPLGNQKPLGGSQDLLAGLLRCATTAFQSFLLDPTIYMHVDNDFNLQ